MRRAVCFGLSSSLAWLTTAGVALSQEPVPDRQQASIGAYEYERPRDRDRLGWYVPDYARLQTGGYVGSVGAGLGYAAFADRLNVTLLYGFTPADRAGHDVHAAKLSVDFRPFDLGRVPVRVVPFYVGAGLLYAFGGEYFTRLPARYRRIDTNYYPPTALHWMVQLGAELDYVPAHGAIERHGLYYEVGTMDSYVFSLFENPKRVRLIDILASTVGYRLAF
jgi:hypothetical protein